MAYLIPEILLGVYWWHYSARDLLILKFVENPIESKFNFLKFSNLKLS